LQPDTILILLVIFLHISYNDSNSETSLNSERKESKIMKFITIGELLMRLSPPDYEKIRTTSSYVVNFGGAEANVAVSLANLGVDTTVFTVLPDNDIGRSAVRSLKANDVHTSPIIFGGERMGVYFLEEGIGVRSSKVIYDRKHSAFAEYDYTTVDFKALLEGYDWLHLSGITPALSNSCQILIEAAIYAARQLGMTISFDCNYRSMLWSFDEARDIISRYLPYVDVLIGIEPLHLQDENGHDLKDGMSMQPDYEEQDRIFQAMADRYHFKAIARHVRYTHSSSENSLKAYLYYNGQTYESKLFRFQILDRVGGGDSFAGGVICGMLDGKNFKDALEYGVAASALKHTIPGDFNLVSRKEVETLAGGDASGRVQR